MNKVLRSSDSCENIQKQKAETENKQFLVVANYKYGQVRCLGQEDPMEMEMATHSGILAWRIPWTEEPSRLQSMGSRGVGLD